MGECEKKEEGNKEAEDAVCLCQWRGTGPVTEEPCNSPDCSCYDCSMNGRRIQRRCNA